jgi:hypothetical protein
MQSGDDIFGVVFDAREFAVELDRALGIADSHLYMDIYLAWVIANVGYPVKLERFYLPDNMSFIQRIVAKMTPHVHEVAELHGRLVYSTLRPTLLRQGYCGEELIVSAVRNDTSVLVVFARPPKTSGVW